MRSFPLIRALPTWWAHVALVICAGLLFGTSAVATVDAAPIITSVLYADATLGSDMAYQIVATNNPTSYTAGTPTTPLPAGLSFDTTTGLISGVPTAGHQAGTTLYQLEITATNGIGSTQEVLQLNLVSPGFQSPCFNMGAQDYGVVGTPLTIALTTTNIAQSFASRNLPQGLSLDATGDIVGTPTTAGVYNCIVTVTNIYFPPSSPTNLVITILAGAGTTGTTTASSASASASAGGSTSASSSATTTGTATAANLPVAVPSDNSGHSCGLGGSLGALLFIGLLLQIRSRRT